MRPYFPQFPIFLPTPAATRPLFRSRVCSVTLYAPALAHPREPGAGRLAVRRQPLRPFSSDQSATRAFRPVGMPGLHSYFITHPPSLTLLFVPFPPNTHRHTSCSVAHSAPGSAAGAGPTQAQQATDTPPGLFSPRAPVSPPPQPPLLRRSFPPRHRRQQPPRLQPRQGWRKLTLWEGAAGSRLKDLL